MQDHTNFATAVADSLRQCIYGKLSVDAVAVDAGDYSAIIQIYDRAVVTLAVICKEQVCEVNASARVASFGCKILLEQIFKYTIRLLALDIFVLRLSGH